MKINAINNVSQPFGAKVNLHAQNKKALFNANLEEKLFKIDSSSKTSIEETVKNYADRLGIKEVNLLLREGVNSVKQSEYGDLLIIKSGPKFSTMRFDNTTSDSELSATILGNIQENYNLINNNKKGIEDIEINKPQETVGSKLNIFG